MTSLSSCPPEVQALVREVGRMRTAQRTFYEAPFDSPAKRAALIAAKEIERRVDGMLRALETPAAPPPQGSLFR